MDNIEQRAGKCLSNIHNGEINLEEIENVIRDLMWKRRNENRADNSANSVNVNGRRKQKHKNKEKHKCR